jgi:hypothetical protein
MIVFYNVVLLWNAKDVHLHAVLQDPDPPCRACEQGPALEPRLRAAPMPDRGSPRARSTLESGGVQYRRYRGVVLPGN